jgi:hypothetical protein
VGSESPAYLKVGLDELNRVIDIGVGDGEEKGMRKVVLKGVGHEVLGNANRGTNVTLVVGIISKFFGED